jgi:mRNA-degrading endonuclease RelE of RelBE toxin-antitoxin system
MPRHPQYQLLFAPETIEHLDAVERKHHGLIRRAIDEQLRYTPERETRNRKPSDRPAPFSATWELRCGPGNRFRVFYEIHTEEQSVMVLAIGIKEGNRLRIGGEEFQT